MSYYVEYAKTGRSSCKRCKENITKASLRIGKETDNHFDADGDSKSFQWFHPECLFLSFKKCRITTKIIDSVGELNGYPDLEDEDKSLIGKLVNEIVKHNEVRFAKNKKRTIQTKIGSPQPKKRTDDEKKGLDEISGPSQNSNKIDIGIHATKRLKTDGSRSGGFGEFNTLCGKLSSLSAYGDKTNHV